MGLLTTPHSYDTNIMEATVTNVDPIRFVCSVKTVRGQFLNEVPWLLPTGGTGKTGMHFAPSIGDQVVVSTALTYPIIMGALPRLGTPSSSLTSVSGQGTTLDAGNNTNMKNGYVGNPNKPADFTPGDMVWTTEGGGIFALLANGSAMLKASALAQIFMSKYDDLVRVVARNWERFSDVGQQTVANVKGRMYEFMGWDRSLDRSKVGIYELQDVIGDVAAGEVLKGEPNPSTALPGVDSRIRKYWLTDSSGVNRMVEILYEDGKTTLSVQDAAGTTNTLTSHEKNKLETTSTAPGSFAKVIITPTAITLNYNGTATTILDATSIRSNFGSASSVLDATASKIGFGAHFISVDGSGVHMG
jgi:hypothetical protein